ncbi:MAG: aminodeoxychorismate synthase component I [Paracoccaceae bacterium]
MEQHSVLFDRGPLRSGSHFRAPENIIEAWDPADVSGALVAMEEARAGGKWLAGYATYELGYLLTPKLEYRLPKERNGCLLSFGVFDGVDAPGPAGGVETIAMAPFEPVWSYDAYSGAFFKVREYIKAGDIYQANLSFPMVSEFNGSLLNLYDTLKKRQPVSYGAYVDLGNTKLLSRSPELFFSVSAQGALRARPMKGTTKRGSDWHEDERLRAELAQSEKNRAENLMITDLLRNDLGRISMIGSVRVPKLFNVETYATVHQMTSEVIAQMLPGTTLREIMTALFPCGSITGAPKIRAMEILSELEPFPRGPYCGAIGWIAPDGAMEFNVAIRTLVCDPSGKITLNVGGGIVYDSSASGEFDEALLKATFAQLAT